MNTRSDDPHPQQPFLKVTREIPLPWLVGAAAAFIVSTTQQWQNQAQQEKNVDKLSTKIERLESSLGTDTTARLLKDQDRDAKILSLTTQVTALETRVNGLSQKR